MARSRFDRKFGAEFWERLPTDPGVYRFLDEQGKPIYVGKAKNLRRRLAQYRKAKRLKRDEKMRRIVHHAVDLEYEVCASDAHALTLELSQIQELRPRFNVSGACRFLYPYLVVGAFRGGVVVARSTAPLPELLKAFPEARVFGPFRSRHFCGEAMDALIEITSYLGFRQQGTRGRWRRDSELPPYTRLVAFRSLDAGVLEAAHRMLGALAAKDRARALGELAVQLLEKPSALKNAAQVQESLRALRLFEKHELAHLHRVAARAGVSVPFEQLQRDRLFLEDRLARISASSVNDSFTELPLSR